MINLEDYQVSTKTGFLPEDPINTIDDSANKRWLDTAANQPKLLPTLQFRKIVEALPEFKDDSSNNLEAELYMRAISYIAHGYLWCSGEIVEELPENLSNAWVTIADKVGRPPILSYPSYCLFNHDKFEGNKDPYIGNISIVENFFAGADEDWFILIHVDIEARAAKAIGAIPEILQAIEDNNIENCAVGLDLVLESLVEVNQTMNRMPELCDPYIYYTRVRPYIFGTKNNPDLPNGLVYKGHFNNEPQFFRGETGAQSSIVPTLDGLLQVEHADDPLKDYLMEMRDYMVPAHRRLIEKVETTSTLKDFIKNNASHGRLVQLYNSIVDQLFGFRAKHLEYASTYIHKQSQQTNNSISIGTGGTPFMTYLAKHRDETKVGLIEA